MDRDMFRVAQATCLPALCARRQLSGKPRRFAAGVDRIYSFTFMMGFADRDYSRQPYGQTTVVGAMRMWSITTWLIVINIAVYVADNISGHRLAEWGYFSASTAIYSLQFWRFITFQFLHANFSHIFFNMLSLYFFGPMVENYLGSRRYLAFYLLCGIAGALFYLILWQLGILISSPDAPLIGASAGIFGILIAGARIAPNATVMLLFPPIPMRLKVMAWILLGIALYTVLANGSNAGGQAAHLGGAALGALLIWKPHSLDIFDRLFQPRRRRRSFMDEWR
jgi:membrane associated rhomboid family serine protease